MRQRARGQKRKGKKENPFTNRRLCYSKSRMTETIWKVDAQRELHTRGCKFIRCVKTYYYSEVLPVLCCFLPPIIIPSSHRNAFVAACRLRRVLGSLNLPNNELKCLLNVVAKTSASFSKRAAKFFAQLPTFIQRDLSLFRLEVTLVSDNHKRYGVCSL